MTRTKDRTALTGLVVTMIAVLGVAASALYLHIEKIREQEALNRPHIHGVLEIKSLSDTTRSLVTGYNYWLLQQYARSNGRTIDICATDLKISYIDSLREGRVDIVVIPYQDSLKAGEGLVSVAVDSISLWLMREDDHHTLKDLRRWLTDETGTPEFEEMQGLFLDRKGLLKSKRAHLSPYDDLIKEHADSLGWDWRLLAALIYSESRFHIEAESVRGAKGLMQLMPATARKYGVTDFLDPDMNIRAGAQLLGTLLDRYKAVGDNMTERYKYALAAYNAGTGRVEDVINYARSKGVDTSYWINVTKVIPEMSDENITATGVVKLGPFKGTETVQYVNAVVGIYNRFCKICPK